MLFCGLRRGCLSESLCVDVMVMSSVLLLVPVV